MVACSLPVFASHSLIVLSVLAEASVFPSGLNATEYTSDVCPLRVARSLPVFASHSLIVWSHLPEASVLPSGLNATEVTIHVCPLRVSRNWGSPADNGDRSNPRQATDSHTTPSIRPTFAFIADLLLPRSSSLV